MTNRLSQISKALITQTSSQTEQNQAIKVQIATQPTSMRRQHIKEVAQLFTKNFLSNNPIWKSFNLDKHEVYKFFVSELQLHLTAEQNLRKEVNNPKIAFNMVYFHEGKVIAAGLNIELYQYLKVSSAPAESQTLQLFSVLEGYGKKLLNSIKLEEHQKGKHIYGSFIVIDEEVDAEIKKAFRTKSLLYTYKGFMDQGFKSLILRTSNVKSQQIYLALGGKILSEVSFELKNQKFQLKLFKLEFDNPAFRKMIGL